MLEVAILDDYANVALQSADWSVIGGKAAITVFDRHLSEEEAAVALQPFDVLCTVRERMSLPRSLFERLPNLKLVTIIGASLPNLDLAAATEYGVVVSHSSVGNPAHANNANATPELTWGLLIAIAALGLGTSLASLFRIGWRHIAVFTGTTIVILTIVTAGLAAMF